MDILEARQLAFTLRRLCVSRESLRADVVEGASRPVAKIGPDGRPTWKMERDARIVFRGGSAGEHSLDLLASSPERILAHWEGYCEANGLLKPNVGERVMFPSGSSPDGLRYGHVVKVGTKRAVVTFKYKHGGISTKSVSFNELRYSGRVPQKPLRAG
jgi:hypothetical protein